MTKRLLFIAPAVTVAGILAIACSGGDMTSEPFNLTTAQVATGVKELFDCPLQGITFTCFGRGPVVLAENDLLILHPELAGEEVDIDVTLAGTFANTLNSVKVDVLTKSKTGTDPYVVVGSTRLGRTVANMNPSLTVPAAETLTVQLTTDIDNRSYNFSKKPQGTVKMADVRVALKPSTATLDGWRQKASDLATDITDFTTVYIALERTVGTLTLTRSDVEGTLRLATREIEDLLEAADEGLTLADLVYPPDYRVPELRGLAKADADMPQPAWRNTKASSDSVEVMFKVYSRALLLSRDMTLVTEGDGRTMLTAVDGALRRRVGLGRTRKTSLDKWAAILSRQLEEVKGTLEKAIRDADAAVEKDGG